MMTQNRHLLQKNTLVYDLLIIMVDVMESEHGKLLTRKHIFGQKNVINLARLGRGIRGPTLWNSSMPSFKELVTCRTFHGICAGKKG